MSEDIDLNGQLATILQGIMLMLSDEQAKPFQNDLKSAQSKLQQAFKLLNSSAVTTVTPVKQPSRAPAPEFMGDGAHIHSDNYAYRETLALANPPAILDLYPVDAKKIDKALQEARHYSLDKLIDFDQDSSFVDKIIYKFIPEHVVPELTKFPIKKQLEALVYLLGFEDTCRILIRHAQRKIGVQINPAKINDLDNLAAFSGQLAKDLGNAWQLEDFFDYAIEETCVCRGEHIGEQLVFIAKLYGIDRANELVRRAAFREYLLLNDKGDLTTEHLVPSVMAAYLYRKFDTLNRIDDETPIAQFDAKLLRLANKEIAEAKRYSLDLAKEGLIAQLKYLLETMEGLVLFDYICAYVV